MVKTPILAVYMLPTLFKVCKGTISDMSGQMLVVNILMCMVVQKTFLLQDLLSMPRSDTVFY